MFNIIDFLLKTPWIYGVDKPSPEIYIKFGEWLQLEDVFRSIWISFMGMLVKGIYSLTHGVEQAFNFVFKLTGFTTYSKLNAFQQLFVAIGLALLSLSIVLFAFEMISGRRLSIHTMLVNVAVVLGIIIALPQAMGVLNEFTVNGTKAVETKGVGAGTPDTSSMSLMVIKDNVVDVGTLAQKSFQQTPNDIVIGGGQLNGFTDANLKAVDFGTMIKAGDKNDTGNRTGDYQKYTFDNTNGQKVLEYGLNSTPENGNSWKNSVVKVSESHWVFKAADTGYQRYVFSFFPIMVQSLVLILLFVFAGMRVVKLIFELGIMRTLAVITAFSNLKSSQKAKELVSTIFWSYMSIVMQLAMIKIFMIFINYGSATVLGAENLSLGAKGFVTIILYVGAFYGVFSGSGYIDRLAGVQSGSSSEVQQFMATYGGARMLGSAATGGVRALSGNTGTGSSQSASSTPVSAGTNPNLTTGLDNNGGINQNDSKVESYSSANSSSNNEVKADSQNSQESNNQQQAGEQSSTSNNDNSNSISNEQDSSESVNEMQSDGDSINDSQSGDQNASHVENSTNAETSNSETNSDESSGINSSSSTSNSNNLANDNASTVNNGTSGSYAVNSNLQNTDNNIPGNDSLGGTSASTITNANSGSYATNSNLESSQSNQNYTNRTNPNIDSVPTETQETTNNITQHGDGSGNNNFGYGSHTANGNVPEMSNPSVEYQPMQNSENNAQYANGNGSWVGNNSSNNNFASSEEYSNSNLKAHPKIDTAVPNPNQEKNNLENTFPNENYDNGNPNSDNSSNVNFDSNQASNSYQNETGQNANNGNSGYDSSDKMQTNYDTNNMYNTNYSNDNSNSSENSGNLPGTGSDSNPETNSYDNADERGSSYNQTGENVTQAMQNFQQSIANDPVLNGKSDDEDDIDDYI